MKRTLLVDPHRPAAEKLSQHITRFFNAAFNRRTTGSRELVDAVTSALADGYTEDEIRIAFWIARCVTGKAAWLSEQLRSDLMPHIVLRHHGRLNNVTGKEAKRWLDDLLARRLEANTAMLTALYNTLPEDMRAEEIALLQRMGLAVQ
jgi:hypothetical protein